MAEKSFHCNTAAKPVFVLKNPHIYAYAYSCFPHYKGHNTI